MRSFIAFTCGVGLLGLVAPARADESAYCRKVRARASADAALLMAPQVQTQGIKFPNNGTIDSGVTTGAGYQFRAVLTYSPLDLYRGLRVVKVADADCEQHEAAVDAIEVAQQGADIARLPALRQERAFLDQKRPAWEAILAKSEERFEAKVTTLLETNELRLKGAELDRKQTQVRGDIARLEARGVDGLRAKIETLASNAERTAMEFERQASHVRSLDPWSVQLSGGVIPQDDPVDYFGIVQIGYNFGGLWHSSYESRYLEARAEEVKGARYEVSEQLRRMRAEAKTAREQARRELAIAERTVSTLSSARLAVEKSEAPNAPHALAVLDLELIGAESERVFLSTLERELAAIEGGGT